MPKNLRSCGLVMDGLCQITSQTEGTGKIYVQNLDRIELYTNIKYLNFQFPTWDPNISLSPSPNVVYCRVMSGSWSKMVSRLPGWRLGIWPKKKSENLITLRTASLNYGLYQCTAHDADRLEPHGVRSNLPFSQRREWIFLPAHLEGWMAWSRPQTEQRNSSLSSIYPLASPAQCSGGGAALN